MRLFRHPKWRRNARVSRDNNISEVACKNASKPRYGKNLGTREHFYEPDVLWTEHGLMGVYHWRSGLDFHDEHRNDLWERTSRSLE